MKSRFLTALPVYNEARHISDVLQTVQKYSGDVLVVDDGSADATPQELARFPQVHTIRHPRNLGYGAGLRTAFKYAQEKQYDAIVTIDCDGQHEPRLIPEMVAALTDGVDIVSGSRYLQKRAGDNRPPEDRRNINQIITAQLNERLGLSLTDTFCGFKAYRVSALKSLEITELGYAMPMQFWVQAVAAGLKIVEFPVPLIYLEEERSFGGALDNAAYRLAHYREVFEREMTRFARRDADALPKTCAPCSSH